MRILNLIPNLSGGGAERQLSHLVPELVRMGHDVHVAYSKEGPHRPKLPGVVLHKIKSRTNYDPYLFLQLFRLIQRIKPDIVHTWILQMDILGGMAARLSGISWTLREPSSAMAYFPTWKHRLRVRVSSGVSAIVSNSQGGDEYWRRRVNGRLPRFVIPNALPLQDIERAVPVPVEELGVHPGQKIVLYVGRFEQGKNLESLVRALGRVARNPKIVAFLCGDGPTKPTVERMINEEGLSGRIFLPGYVKNVWSWMKRADVFVSVSLFEGMPNTVMEAMACGCPIVASDIPQHREIMDEGEATFVLSSDPDAIASGIERLIGNPEEAQRRALCSKERVTRWSITAMAASYERVYMEILGPWIEAARRPTPGQL
jgi:glycosyltransferase involved in cell wall biosynthesis